MNSVLNQPFYSSKYGYFQATLLDFNIFITKKSLATTRAPFQLVDDTRKIFFKLQ